MLAAVEVRPLVITINQGNTFMVTTKSDAVDQDQEKGMAKDAFVKALKKRDS